MNMVREGHRRGLGPLQKFWWNLRLMFWLAVHGYEHWFSIRRLILLAWDDDCWSCFREDGETPRGAVLEDLSCA